MVGIWAKASYPQTLKDLQLDDRLGFIFPRTAFSSPKSNDSIIYGYLTHLTNIT